jgi:hypothetical protein
MSLQTAVRMCTHPVVYHDRRLSFPGPRLSFDVIVPFDEFGERSVPQHFVGVFRFDAGLDPSRGIVYVSMTRGSILVKYDK